MFIPVSSAVFVRMLLALCLLVAFHAQAEPVIGKDYVLAPNPQPSGNLRQIDVVEVFSYACPHCFDLEPALVKWEKTLPKDIAVIRLPAVWNPQWLALGKLYYALEALGKAGELHGNALNAYHLHRINLANERVMREWVAKQGVDPGKFAEMYGSFSVQAKVMRAKQILPAYGISGVPSMVVGGKYVTSTSMAGGQDAMLSVVDYLVAKIRKETGWQKL